MDISNVTYSAGKVLSVEKVSDILLPSLANGLDADGDHTVQALTYLIDRFGSTTSFTGTYYADRFTMSIDRTSQQPGKDVITMSSFHAALYLCHVLNYLHRMFICTTSSNFTDSISR